MKKIILTIFITNIVSAAQQPAKQFQLSDDAVVVELSKRSYSTKIGGIEVSAYKEDGDSIAHANCANVGAINIDAVRPFVASIIANPEQVFLQLHGRYLEQQVGKLAKKRWF